MGALVKTRAILIPTPCRDRPAGWEARLNAEILAASRKGFDVRDWNCARFAHTCAQSVSGREIPYVWKGSLEDSVDAVLARHCNASFARAGDVVLARVPAPSLGVCVGRYATFVTKKGLLQVPMNRVSVAWVI